MTLALRAVPSASAATQNAVIRAQGLSKTYTAKSGPHVHALDPIDLDINDGEFVSVVGPSGCGKSTLLRLIAGLDPQTGGTLALGGRAVEGPSNEVGVVFQAANLLPWLTVRENVRLPLRVGGREWKVGNRVDDLIAMTGLSDFAERYPYELSGGMQQRAGICRALARDPKILLMDEPFGALDALTRERMNLELQRIWQTNAKTILLITHSISEAIFLGSRVIVMSARPGRIIADLPVDIPRPRSLDAILAHPSYQSLSRQIRALLNAQGEVE
ncbi:MAG: ABC transporter ATP-binding protein [Proteobacteria bacterium]|nr:ABC transporter ATP-binding protein [Pseudomonadota bacterium]